MLTKHANQIGYYHLCGADKGVLQGTEFEPYFDVYKGAWDRIINSLRKAKELGIGVLLGVWVCSDFSVFIIPSLPSVAPYQILIHL